MASQAAVRMTMHIHQCEGPVGQAAILDNQFSLCQESWDMATDNELDQTGGDLTKRSGWDWLGDDQALPNTPVSYCSIKTTVGGKHTIVN
jgi:hypothetical protein